MNNDCRTALMGMFFDTSGYERVELLLKNGTTALTKDKDGKTALALFYKRHT